MSQHDASAEEPTDAADTSADTPGGGASHPTHGPGPVVVWRLMWLTISQAWDHAIFAKAATAAFWQTLSLPPLIIGLVGSVGYVAPWFGPNVLADITVAVLDFARTIFSSQVVDEVIAPTVDDIMARPRASVISFGFILSLWAGSSAVSTFVDSIVHAHEQQDARNPIWQRIFSLLLYVGFLFAAVFVLPVIALGPSMIGSLIPSSWHSVVIRIIDIGYFPFVGAVLIVGLTTLYKLALHKSLPFHRLLPGALLAGIFFLAASVGLRAYLSVITAAGLTYGALSGFIAFLLFTFFLGFAIVLGAEFNAALQSFWPARATRIEQVRGWITERTAIDPGVNPIGAITRLATSPIRNGEATTVPSGEAPSGESPPEKTPSGETPSRETPPEELPTIRLTGPGRLPDTRYDTEPRQGGAA